LVCCVVKTGIANPISPSTAKATPLIINPFIA
jgi:hypothetical protein